jgi:hypothetical protein
VIEDDTPDLGVNGSGTAAPEALSFPNTFTRGG